jgi:beta-ureidopropionase / N-carbamoyl-L-amino-acid hydrolase
LAPGLNRSAAVRSPYFEAHIEQGPILEAAGKPIGVVTGAQGQRWYTGQEAHAGPTSMPRRRDALWGRRE